MTTGPDRSDVDGAGPDRLARAAGLLRGRASPRAVEIADDVLATALRSSRRSLPIRALPPHEHVSVSDQVLISRLRERIDDGLPACSVGRVLLRVDPDASLRELTVELFVRYGEVLMDVADRARVIAAAVLAEVLGATSATVAVVPTHVHVSDVTRGDPHLVDPSDEW